MGEPLPISQLKSLRQGFQSGAPTAHLLLPNPIDATGDPNASSADSSLLSRTKIFSLFDMLDPARLDSSFIKTRIRSIDDSESTLATPDSQGRFRFAINDVRYSETLAYHSLSTITRYVEGLGFGLVKNRPLYVLVRAADSTVRDPNSVNAFYDHNYLNPKAPRIIRMVGDVANAPGMDREMYWHEFGHYFTESASFEQGIDFAVDSGATYTEASALHECMADIITQSIQDKAEIGRWIVPEVGDSSLSPGDPLRSAQDTNGAISFDSVATFNGSPIERYPVAEWCTRALWDIRDQFKRDFGPDGSFYFERMAFSALGLLKRDASLAQFKDALQQADTQMHCGGHVDTIEQAFASRGFTGKGTPLQKDLSVKIVPVGIKPNGGTDILVKPAPGLLTRFAYRITNNNSVTARNVRVTLEGSSNLVVRVYMQAYGDLPPGASVLVDDNQGLGIYNSVSAMWQSNGGQTTYKLSVLSENGRPVVEEGTLQ